MWASTKEAVVCVAATTNVIKVAGCGQVRRRNVVKVAGCGQVPRKQWCA